jgi:inorganic pyrophosphatase
MQPVMRDSDFWHRLDELVATCGLVIDRPKGSPHPRYPDYAYPLDYGYLEGTRSGDGSEIDVWIGSLGDKRVSAVVCTVDLLKQDTEVKILIGCTHQEAQLVLAAHTAGSQAAVLVKRGAPDS